MLEVAGFTVSKDPYWFIGGNLLVLVPPLPLARVTGDPSPSISKYLK